MGRYTMEPGRSNPQGDLMGSWSVRDALTHKIVRNFPVDGRDKAEAWIHANGGFWQVRTEINQKAAEIIQKKTAELAQRNQAKPAPKVFESTTAVEFDETKSVTIEEATALVDKITALEKETEAMMNRALDFGPIGQVSTLLAAKQALTSAAAQVSIFKMLSPWDAMKGGAE